LKEPGLVHKKKAERQKRASTACKKNFVPPTQGKRNPRKKEEAKGRGHRPLFIWKMGEVLNDRRRDVGIKWESIGGYKNGIIAPI